MSDKKSFGYLGNTFQIQLLNNIILYKDFSNSILEVIDPHYFDNQYFRIICQMIKEYYSKYEHTPTFDTLEQLTKSEISSPMAQKSVLEKGIKEVQPLPSQEGNMDWGDYYYRQADRTKSHIKYVDDAIRDGIKETWGYEKQPQKRIDEVIMNGQKD